MDERGDASLLVSIVIPVYNGASYLAQAIDSALAQTWPHVEIIVVDDGSDDDGETARIAAGYGDRIRYHYKANGGVATAINTGIQLMRGHYFSWLSHDDLFMPDKIECQIQALLAHGGPAMAFGDYGTMDADGNNRVDYRIGHLHVPSQPLLGLMSYMVNGCAVLVHRDCLEGQWLDPGLPSTQDYDLWLRIASRYPLIHVPGIAVYSRQHAAQGSRSARFLDEVLLLWLSILDRVEALPSMRLRLTGNAPDFARILDSYAVQGLPALRPEVQRRMAEQARGCCMAVVVTGKCDTDCYESLANTLFRAGIVLSGIWAIKPAGSDLQEIRLRWTKRREARVYLSVGGTDDMVHSMLSRACELSEAEFIWLFDAATSATDMPSHAIPLLRARPDAVMCIQEGRTQDVLAGAMFRRSALEAALAGPRGLSALVQALARQGAVIGVSLPGAAERQSLDTSTPQLAGAPPSACQSGPIGLPLPMRISFTLLRRPVWAGLVWRLMRVAFGTQARDRLLRWTGLQGQMDAAWYLRAYPEVAAADVDPVFHYLLFGQREGRDPSPAFDTQAYLDRYPVVKQQGLNALQHYVAWGRRYSYQVQASMIGPQPPQPPDAQPAVLLVLDGSSDDAVRFAGDLALQLASKRRVLFLIARGSGELVFGGHSQGHFGRRLKAVQHRAILKRLLSEYGIVRTMMLDHGDFAAVLLDEVAALGLPYDFVLLGHGSGGDGSKLTGWLTGPDRQRLLSRADTVFATSQVLAQKLYNDNASLAVTVALPPDPHRLRGFRPWAQPVSQGSELRIALFGYITEASGRQVLLDMLREIQAQRQQVRLMLFGRVNPALPLEVNDALQVWPALKGAVLVEQVVAKRPHLAWFPCKAPVDNGYALTDAEAVGLPIAASGVGEALERLHRRQLSWLFPVETTAGEWLAWFLQLQRTGFDVGFQTVHEPFSQRFHDADIYRRHLLRRL